MQSTLQTLEQEYPDLKRAAGRAPWAAITFNLGPATICWPHRDSSNAIHYLCLDGSAGRYDWTRGGHLILHEAMLIIQLRPGDIILFPSALITHENVPIAPSETRFGITAYSAGAFRRFVAQGLRTQKAWEAEAPEAKATHDAEAENRWAEGCAMFKTIPELLSRYQVCSLYPTVAILTELCCSRFSQV